MAVAIQATAQYTYQSGSGVPATVLSIVFFGFGATGSLPTANALNDDLGSETQTGAATARIPARSVRIVPGHLGISALLLAELLVTAALAALGRILPSSLTPQGFPLWRAVTLVVSWAFLALAIALVYRILPDAKIAWRDVRVGAGISACCSCSAIT